MNKTQQMAMDMLIESRLNETPQPGQKHFNMPTIYLPCGGSKTWVKFIHGDHLVLDDLNQLYGYRKQLIWKQGPTYRLLLNGRWETIRTRLEDLEEVLVA